MAIPAEILNNRDILKKLLGPMMSGIGLKLTFSRFRNAMF